MSEAPRIIAVGLLTQYELELLGKGFDRAFPLNEARDFDDLLRAIDEADRRLRDSEQTSPQSGPAAPRQPS